MKIFRAPSVFQGKRELLKNPECKKHIQYSEHFQGNFVFQGQAQVAQKYELWKIFNTVYIHLGAIRVTWASVVCNQDQRRDWL